MEIRKYRKSDFKSVKYVCRTGKHFNDHLEYYNDNYYSPYVGIINKKIVAVLVTYRQGESLHVEHVEVDPEHRSKGIGTELMNHADQIAKKQGLKAVMLETLETNKRAQKLYKKLGYKLVGKFKNYYDEPMQLFRRKLRFGREGI